MCNASEENRPTSTDTPARHTTEGHEPWCDLAQHALTLESGLDALACVGPYTRNGSVGGWLSGNDSEDGSARIAVDWRPADWESLTPQEAADLLGFLAAMLAQYGTAAR